MENLRINTVLIFLLLFLTELEKVTGRETCQETNLYEYYCDSGYHCCEFNTKCCKSKLSGLAITGIVIGSLFGLVFLCGCFSAIMITIAECYSKHSKVKPQNEQDTPQDSSNNTSIAQVENTAV